MKFDVISTKKIWFALSIALVVISLGALLFKGLNFSLEFTGGTSISWKFDDKVSVEEVRGAMSKFGLGGSKSIIQPLGEPGDNEVIIRTEFLETAERQKEVADGIQKELGGERISITSVGAAWGKQVTDAAAIALVLSIIAILLYLSIRFEYKMALTAVIALAHDMIIAVGIYALVGREVSPATIAAFLTVLGYSLYDTIVVFHRILENSRTMGKQTYSDMANSSVRQVIVRSMNTSVTTLLPIVAILFFGGETLKDFAFALLVGIVPATYSSVFLAAPLLATIKEKEPRFVALRRRIEAGEAGEVRQKYQRKKSSDKSAAGPGAGASETVGFPEGEVDTGEATQKEPAVEPKQPWASARQTPKKTKKRKKR